MQANLYALGAIALWASLASLGVSLTHVPPFLLTGIALLIGSVPAWPLLLGVALRWPHVLAAVLGFGGAAMAITGGRSLSGALAWGYLPALAAAFIWASYSLLTRRVPAFPTTAIGLFGLVSGLLSLLCHVLLEPSVTLQARDAVLLTVLGLGPLGGAFYLWDKALKLGDARHIGILSYATPLASTALLVLVSGQRFHASLALSTAMILSAAVLGMRAK